MRVWVCRASEPAESPELVDLSDFVAAGLGVAAGVGQECHGGLLVIHAGGEGVPRLERRGGGYRCSRRQFVAAHRHDALLHRGSEVVVEHGVVETGAPIHVAKLIQSAEATRRIVAPPSIAGTTVMANG